MSVSTPSRLRISAMAWTTRMAAPFQLHGRFGSAIIAAAGAWRNEASGVEVFAVERAGPHRLDAVPAGLRDGTQVLVELRADRNHVAVFHAGEALRVFDDA